MIEFHISLNPTSFDNIHLFLEDDNKHLITQTKQKSDQKIQEWSSKHIHEQKEDNVYRWH